MPLLPVLFINYLHQLWAVNSCLGPGIINSAASSCSGGTFHLSLCPREFDWSASARVGQRSRVTVNALNPGTFNSKPPGRTMVSGMPLFPLVLTVSLLACQRSSGFWIVNVVFPPNARPQQAPSNSTPPVVIGKFAEEPLLQSKTS